MACHDIRHGALWHAIELPCDFMGSRELSWCFVAMHESDMALLWRTVVFQGTCLVACHNIRRDTHVVLARGIATEQADDNCNVPRKGPW